MFINIHLLASSEQSEQIEEHIDEVEVKVSARRALRVGVVVSGL